MLWSGFASEGPLWTRRAPTNPANRRHAGRESAAGGVGVSEPSATVTKLETVAANSVPWLPGRAVSARLSDHNRASERSPLVRRTTRCAQGPLGRPHRVRPYLGNGRWTAEGSPYATRRRRRDPQSGDKRRAVSPRRGDSWHHARGGAERADRRVRGHDQAQRAI